MDVKGKGTRTHARTHAHTHKNTAFLRPSIVSQAAPARACEERRAGREGAAPTARRPLQCRRLSRCLLGELDKDAIRKALHKLKLTDAQELELLGTRRSLPYLSALNSTDEYPQYS